MGTNNEPAHTKGVLGANRGLKRETSIELAIVP